MVQTVIMSEIQLRYWLQYIDKIADLVKLTWKQLKVAAFWEKLLKCKKKTLTSQMLDYSRF